MSNIPKRKREVQKVADEFGGVVEGESGGGHLVIRLPNGRKFYTSITPSDHRSLKNLRSSLRRKASER